MSGGSVKELTRLLSNALSSNPPQYPPSDELLNGIQTYLNKHSPIEENESQHLHEELLRIFETQVQGNAQRTAVFLGCIRNLRPALIGTERLLKWWEVMVKPTFDSMGQAKTVITDAREIVLSVLVYEEDDDPTGQKKAASSCFTDKLLEIYLDKTRVALGKGNGVQAEQQYRFVSQNVEAVLLAYAKYKAQNFMEKIDYYITQKEYRLQILGLLCSYVQKQGAHLYLVTRTPLFDHLLQCLENDTSTTVISLALTILIMFMPHLCNSLGQYLPRLFVIYTRVLCWDKFGVVRLEVHSNLGSYSRAASPLSAHGSDITTNSTWQKLDSSFETTSSTTPDVSDYFSFLYGLYPINFFAFIREPYKFLDRSNYKDIDQLDIDEETVRARTDPYRQRHVLHPNFMNLTADTELSDQSRWMRVEPGDITAQCIGLVVNNTPVAAPRPRVHTVNTLSSTLPDNLIPEDDIPHESLLARSPDDLSSPSKNGTPPVLGPIQRTNGDFGFSLRDPKSPDSPTIPTFHGPQEDNLEKMLRLQDELQANLHHSINTDLMQHTPTPPPQSALPHPPGPPPTYPGSVTSSPRLGQYAQSLVQDNMPRSPALRPAASDTAGTIAYLQREVMLLKNDLNFERYLKQQHLSHIGHLQRRHIKESAAEAETQNLINTNRSLKAKLEEAKKLYAQLHEEKKQIRDRANDWEKSLQTKIRTLVAEQKAWRQDEQATKQALEIARNEAEHLRKLLAESEVDGLQSRQNLQTMSQEMEEVNKLRTFVDHLSKKVSEYQQRAEEYEKKGQKTEHTVSENERLKMRLQSREAEIVKIKRTYESKFQEMESRLSSLSTPLPATPGGGFQDLIDDALSVANSRFESLKRAHQHLLRKYTDLEIKYMELQTQIEMSGGSFGYHMSRSTTSDGNDRYYPSSPDEGPSGHSSGGPGTSNASGHPVRASSRSGGPPQYQEGDSMSQISSYHDAKTRGGGGFFGHGNFSPDTTDIRTADFPFPRQQRSLRPLRHSPSVPEGFSTGPHTPGDNSAAASPIDGMSLYSHGSNSYASTEFRRPQTSGSGMDDARSTKTVTSTTSSERRKRAEKIKASSQVRMRGRGGGQNVGMKVKEAKEKDENGNPVEKKKKKSMFQTGSGLAGIRGFV